MDQNSSHKDPSGYQAGADYSRVPYPDHPDRCQAIGGSGDQCSFFKLHGDYCRMHGGVREQKKAQRRERAGYKLAKYEDRIRRLGTSYSLRDEVGIARMTLETLLEQVQTPADLVIHSGRVQQLVAQIEKVVVSAKKLDSALGELLDRDTLDKVCDAVVQVVQQHVPEEALAKVAEGIQVAVARIIVEGEK